MAVPSYPPPAGYYQPGNYATDQSGALWVCTTSGYPGTWLKHGYLDSNAADIQPAGNGGAAGTTGMAADAGHVHPTLGAYLGAPQIFAPAAATNFTASSTSLAAFATGTLCTSTFTAPSSGKVLVTASFAFQTSTAGAAAMFGLAISGDTTPAAAPVNITQGGSAATLQQVSMPFWVTGLSAATLYQFDLLGAASTGNAVIAAYAQTAVTYASTKGSSVIVTVQGF